MTIYNPLRVFYSIALHPGNATGKLSAIKRYLKWQISARLMGMTMVMPWINESKLFISLHEAMVTHNYYTGLYEYDDMIFLLRYINQDDVFIDAGANSGVYTVLAAKVKGARVIAFEPVPKTYARLLDNVKLNEISSLALCINIGLAECSGELNFTISNDATNRVMHKNEIGSSCTKIPVSTLDDQINKYAVDPTILKIDVEGYEYFILEGGKKFLANQSLNVIIIELNNSGLRYGYTDEDVALKIQSHGFKTYNYDANNNKIIYMPTITKEKQNTLFIRDINLVKSRLQNINKYKVHPINKIK